MRSRLFRPTLDSLDARVVPAAFTVGTAGKFDFDTIQAAVDAAELTPEADLIRVRPGTYTEQVRIEGDDITLRSTTRYAAVIQAPPGLPQFSFLVTVAGADDVVIDGFTVRGPAAKGDVAGAVDVGIAVGGGAQDVVVTNNKVTDIRDFTLSGVQSGIGILVQGADAEVSNNIVRQYQKAGIVALNDVVEGEGDAPDVVVPTTVRILDNTVTGIGATAVIAQNGIQVSDGADALVKGNTVSRNVYTRTAVDTFEAGGVVVGRAGLVTVADNELDDNQVGVLVQDQTAGLVIVGNDIDNSTRDGISLTNSRAVLVKGNEVDDSGRDGIRLDGTDFAVVVDNEVDDSGRYGIALLGTSSFNLVAFNDVDDSDLRDVFVGPAARFNLVFANG